QFPNKFPKTLRRSRTSQVPAAWDASEYRGIQPSKQPSCHGIRQGIHIFYPYSSWIPPINILLWSDSCSYPPSCYGSNNSVIASIISPYTPTLSSSINE